MSGRALWICAAITAASALVSAGYSIAALGDRPAVNIIGLYAASRSVAILAVLVPVLLLRSARGLLAVAAVMMCVQFFDAGIGVLQHDAPKTYGPLVLAAASLWSLLIVVRSNARTTD